MERYDVWLRNRIHHINVYIRSLSFREDISVRNRLVLETLPLGTELQKTIQLNESGLVFDTSMGDWVIRTVFEKGENDLQLGSSVGEIFSQKTVYDLDSDMILDIDSVNAIKELYVSCGNLLELSEASAVNTSKESFFGGSDDLFMQSQLDRGHAHKSVQLSHETELVSSVHAIIERLCSVTTTEFEITGTASILATRYRMLFEMDSDGTDDLYLSDFDGMSLEDIDYVVY